tara:strand:+ start:741 stop:1160 length:420 start_codon:yes stop_codon:yes gene_type:complete
MKRDFVVETNLKQISMKEGDILHALKKTDGGFKEFGEIYFSKINYKKIKAWKMHTQITLNLVVPFGNVEFAFLDNNGTFKTIFIGDKNYKRVTIPPGIWHGFKGHNREFSIIASIIDQVHDPNEIVRKELNSYDYSWKD